MPETRMNRELKFYQAIQEALDQILSSDSSSYLMGLGVPDPKGVFGTTTDLHIKHGSHRVLDMPTSENAMTGVAIGSTLTGMRPIMTHQRVDFFLLALDQLINNGAKWHYMFGGKNSIPLVIRLIIGRGWGQGPQHSQSLHSLFAHIPGLKVVMPSSAYDAKGLLIAAHEDPNPVIYLEHRWLHNTFGEVPSEYYSIPLGKARKIHEGNDITVVAFSHMALEAWKAIQLVTADLSIDLIDLRTIKPWDKEMVLESVKKTGRILVVDSDWKTVGFAAEIISTVTEELFSFLKIAPRRLTLPDRHCPTSWTLANHYYPLAKDIAISLYEMMEKPIKARELLKSLIEHRLEKPLDVPDASFSGPF